MLTEIKKFVKTHQSDIILVIGVVLISLLSFALGFIVAKEWEKEPIKIQYNTNYEFYANAANARIRIFADSHFIRRFALWL